MVSRIEELAEHLLREGHVDNEPDARVAAIRILLTLADRRHKPVEDQDDDLGGVGGRV